MVEGPWGQHVGALTREHMGTAVAVVVVKKHTPFSVGRKPILS